MADGRVARFEVPDDATQEDVMREASRLKSPAKEQPKPRNRGLGIPMLDKAVSGANEALLGFGQGLENVGAFITDPLVRMVGGKDVLENERKARAGRWDTASRTISPNADPTARTVGQVAAAMVTPVPKIAGVGKVAATANRAIQGAMGGAAVRASDQSAAMPATIGAAANVLLPPVLSKIAQSAPGRAVGRAVGRAGAPLVSAADDASEAILSRVRPATGLPYTQMPQLPPPSAPVTAPLAGLGRKAEARAARFKALGIDDPTTGMVTRDPNAFSFEQNAAKIQGAGDDLQRQIRNVETSLVDKGRELVRRSGGAPGQEDTGLALQRALQPRLENLRQGVDAAERGLAGQGDDLVRSLGGARGAEETGRSAQSVLDTKRAEMQQVTSKLYTAVREARGEVSAGPLNPLRDALDDPMLTDNPAFDQMREGIMRRMQRLGMAGQSGLLRNESVATVGQAEELRKFIGGLGDGRDPAVKMVRSRLIDALDDGVVESVGDDAFKAARASARARFEEFSKTFAGRVADEGIAPEALTRRVLGDGTSLADLRAMRQSLTTGTPEQAARGTQAWNGIRAQAVDDLLSASRTPDGALDRNALARRFVRSAPKMREILGADDFNNLRRLVAASRDRAATARLEEFSGTLAGRIASEGVAPEGITGRILSSRTSLADLRNLRQTLGTNEAGSAAWKGLRAQAVDDLLSRSTNDEGKLLGGQLSRDFYKQSAKFRELLDPADFKQLRRLVQASRDATVAPPMSSVNYSNTAITQANLFDGMKEPVKQGWAKFLIKTAAKHGAAFAAGGPPANIGVIVGEQVAASAAQKRAADQFARQIELARNPEQVAALMRSMQKAAESNPAVASLMERWQNLAGGSGAAQGAAAAEASGY